MNTKMPLSELGKTLGRTLAVGVAVLEAACGGSPATPTKQIVTEPTAARPPATATVEPTKTAFPTQEIKATATPEPATGGELPRVVAFRENILKQMLERSHPLYGAGSPPQIRAEDEDAPLGKAGWKIILKGEGFVGVQEYDKNGVNLGRVLTGLSKSKPGDQELITDVDFVPPDLVNQPYVVLAGKNLEWKNGTWYRDGNLSLGQSAKQLLSRDKMTWVNESDPATPTVAPTPKPNLTPPKVTPDTIITPAVNNTEVFSYARITFQKLQEYAAKNGYANIISGGAVGYYEDNSPIIAGDGSQYRIPGGNYVGIVKKDGSGWAWVFIYNSLPLEPTSLQLVIKVQAKDLLGK